MHYYLYKYRVQIVILTLLAVYGVWQVASDAKIHGYPQRIANHISIPPRVDLVDSEIIYVKRCSSSNIIQYFTTNEPWEAISSYYTVRLQTNWQPSGDGLQFYQRPSAHEQIYLVIHRIDLSQEEFPRNPLLKQSLMKGTTAYSLLVDYKQDLRVYEGICKPED